MVTGQHFVASRQGLHRGTNTLNYEAFASREKGTVQLASHCQRSATKQINNRRFVSHSNTCPTQTPEPHQARTPFPGSTQIGQQEKTRCRNVSRTPYSSRPDLIRNRATVDPTLAGQRKISTVLTHCS